jgi:hypothetical protein
MADNLAEFYLDKLNTENNSGLVLARFFCELFGLPLDKGKIIMFNKLVKLYSKDNLFFSILDCYDVENLNTDKVYPLLVYMCKKRIENKLSKQTPMLSLTTKSDSIIKKIDSMRRRRIVIKNPFEES